MKGVHVVEGRVRGSRVWKSPSGVYKAPVEGLGDFGPQKLKQLVSNF